MLYIHKQDEPEFLSEFRKNNPKKDYDSKEFTPYRVPLNDLLRHEQRGLCAYCCSRISKGTSHNEHIEPRHPGKYDYDLDGQIEGDEYTIKLLNLNSYDLQNARKSVIRTLQTLNGDKELIRNIFMDEDSEELQPYFDVIKWYFASLG